MSLAPLAPSRRLTLARVLGLVPWALLLPAFSPVLVVLLVARAFAALDRVGARPALAHEAGPAATALAR